MEFLAVLDGSTGENHVRHPIIKKYQYEQSDDTKKSAQNGHEKDTGLQIKSCAEHKIPDKQESLSGLRCVLER